MAAYHSLKFLVGWRWVIWLPGKAAPDFKTIANFRQDKLAPLRGVNRQFGVLCRKLVLFGGELLAIDGTEFGVVNARNANFNAAKLEDLIAYADARLAEYLEALDDADATEPDFPDLDKAQFAQKTAKKPNLYHSKIRLSPRSLLGRQACASLQGHLASAKTSPCTTKSQVQ